MSRQQSCFQFKLLTSSKCTYIIQVFNSNYFHVANIQTLLLSLNQPIYK